MKIIFWMLLAFTAGTLLALSGMYLATPEMLITAVNPPRETIIMEVTAYCPCEKCCGRWADGFFADGSPVGGRAVAADTSIYPFGTEFDVPDYGVAVVKDRGGAIKGKNRLDLYFSTHQEALNWGRQTIEVTKP